MSFGTVWVSTDPYHPAVIAQTAATLAEMYSGRFWLAIGGGDAHSEVVTGTGRPGDTSRQARLVEFAALIRALWAGEAVSTRGAIAESVRLARAHSARALFTLLGAPTTAETARGVASWVDGLLTVAGRPEQIRAVVDAFRCATGGSRPIILQAVVSFAPIDAEATATALQQCDSWTLDGRAG